MLKLRFDKALVALLLTSVLASCGGGTGDVAEPTPAPVVLFDVSDGEYILTGVNVYSGSKNGIQKVTGTTSPDGTEIEGLLLNQENRLPSRDFPHGITMDGFGEGSHEDLGYAYVYDEFGFLKKVFFFRDYRIETYLAAPISSNENPGPEFSMLYRTFVTDAGRLSLDYAYNNSYGFYGVAGLATEVLPEATAEYQGIWVGKVSNSNEFWGDAYLLVDFDSGDVTGLLDNPIRAVGTPDLLLGDITIAGKVIDGEIIGEATVDIDFGTGASTFSGPAIGDFYGPSAEEAGGVFDTSSEQSTSTFTGAFIVKQ